MARHAIVIAAREIDSQSPFWAARPGLRQGLASLGELPRESANALRERLEASGYGITPIGDDPASLADAHNAIHAAVDALVDGDDLVVSFCGHGVRRSAGGERHDRDGLLGKALDEGWALTDGVFWDDDLTRVVGRLPEGARLTVISDACWGAGIADVARWRPAGRAAVWVWSSCPAGLQVVPAASPTPFTRALVSAWHACRTWNDLRAAMPDVLNPTPVLDVGGAARTDHPLPWLV